MRRKFVFNPLEGTFDLSTADDTLERVDTNVFEAAQDGVEYFAPIQYGGRFGDVFRQYFTIADVALGVAATIALGLTPNDVLYVGGYVVEATSGDKILIGTGSGNTASNQGIHVQVQGANLVIDPNDALDWDSGFCWIDYTKTP